MDHYCMGLVVEVCYALALACLLNSENKHASIRLEDM